MKIHLCCDFDLTITNYHTGGIYKKIDLDDLKSKELLLQLFRKTIEDHYLSIVTHGESETMIRETLALIGLTEEEVAKVVVVTGMADDKNSHIEESYRRQGLLRSSGRLTVSFSIRTLLLEDVERNGIAAAKQGASVLISQHSDDISHLESALKIITTPSTIDQECSNHARQNGYRERFETAGIKFRAA